VLAAHTSDDGSRSRAAARSEAERLAELLARAATRDRDAFRALYEAVGPRVRAFVRSRCKDPGLADEITQEVLLTLWRRADRYDPSRARPMTWIFTMARNRVIDAQRHRKVVEADRRDPHFVPEPPPPVDANLLATRRAERIRAALDTLPDPQRAVLVQAFFEGRSYPEIAESEGVALGTVKSRARLGFQRLRDVLAEEGG
jgi:RNA polymerase sigma-70 factor (ECF subfamily)